MVLRQRIGQLDNLAEMKREEAAGTTGLRLPGIGVGEARIEFERHAGDPFGAPQSRGGAESPEAVIVSKVLKGRSKGGKVLAAAKQAAVMREAVGSKLEAARAHSHDEVPIYRVLGEGKVPGRAEAVTFLDIGDSFNAFEACAALDVMGEHDAALEPVGPEADVPSVGHTDGVERLPQPFAPEIHQSRFAWPVGKLTAAARAHGHCV